MIVCDHCDSRTRQPLPYGWRVLWIGDLRAYGHACPSCGARRDAGEVLLTLAAPAATLTAVRAFAERVASERSDEAELRDLPQGDKSPSAPPLSTPAPMPPHGSDAPPSPKLIEPAPGVEIYDRPRLPRSLRDAAPRDGATVEAFVRQVGETFVPPATTRPRGPTPTEKSPSEPPAPVQRSLFGGDS